MFCMNCGKEIDEQAKFCQSCGKPIINSSSRQDKEEQSKHINLAKEYCNQQQYNDIEVSYNNINTKREDMIGENKVSTLRVMIGENVNHYIGVFKEIEEGGTGGATPLALIAPFWFVYRKMYKQFIIIVAINIITTFLSIIGLCINIGVLIYLSMNMRKMYYEFVNSKLESNNLTGKDVNDDEKYLRTIKKIGQTSCRNVVLYMVLSILSTIILSCIVAAMVDSADDYNNTKYIHNTKYRTLQEINSDIMIKSIEIS